VHFLLIGVTLFVVYDVIGGSRPQRDGRIVISAGDIERVLATWQKQWMRPPTERELQGLVDSQIREEVLYREARAIGLDEDDTIIRRRLAQKLEFVAQDLAGQTEPTDEELSAFLDDNADRFEIPPSFTFGHVYLSHQQRGDAIAADAEGILAALRAGADPSDLGDRFMLQRSYVDRTQQEIGQLFGRAFAARLLELEGGAWQGPVESGYGLHLVRIDRSVSSRAPLLDEVRADVREELLAERRREANEAMVTRLRGKYEVVIEWPATDDAP